MWRVELTPEEQAVVVTSRIRSLPDPANIRRTEYAMAYEIVREILEIVVDDSYPMQNLYDLLTLTICEIQTLRDKLTR